MPLSGTVRWYGRAPEHKATVRPIPAVVPLTGTARWYGWAQTHLGFKPSSKNLAHSGCGTTDWHNSVVRLGTRTWPIPAVVPLTGTARWYDWAQTHLGFKPSSKNLAHSGCGTTDWHNSVVRLSTTSLGFQTLQQEPSPFQLWCPLLAQLNGTARHQNTKRLSGPFRL